MAGLWDIIIPEETTNYGLNPVAGASGNFADVAGGVTTIVTTYSYFGYQCYNHVFTNNNDGVTFTLRALPNAIAYVTLRVHESMSGWDWSLDGANFTAPTLLYQEGDWYVYGAAFVAAQANGSTALRVYQNGAVAITFHTGHFQVESGKSYATTPVTGNLKGLYSWAGTAHGSTSTRSSQERGGGRLESLEDYGISVTFNDGVGMPPNQHITQAQPLLAGAVFRGRKILPRVLTMEIVPSPTAPDDVPDLSSIRKGIVDIIKSDLVKGDQPFVLRYWGASGTRPVHYSCTYGGGMEYGAKDSTLERIQLSVVCYDPYVYEPMEGAASLTTSLSVADADYVIKKIAGTWSNISGAFDAAILAVTKGIDGCYYIGGRFSDVGDANGDGIIKYDPSTGAISSLGTGLTFAAGSGCNTLVTAPNGDIYAGGNFSAAGGVAGTRGIACWDISAAAWVSVGGGFLVAGDDVRTLAFDHSGNLYIGGDFDNHGDANGDNITMWDGAAYSSLGSGMNGAVSKILCGINGNIFAVGYFTASGATTLNYAGEWDGTSWSALSTGANNIAVTAVMDAVGRLYIGGAFTTVGGVSANRIAVWNGTYWSPLAGGLDNTCWCSAISDDGLLYVGGAFTAADSLSVANQLAIWNGFTWAHLDADLPAGGADPHCIFLDGDNIVVGYFTAGSATTSYLNTVTNSGTASAYPKFVFTRTGGTSAVVEWVKNETTGDTLWLNYALLDGETLTIDLTQSDRSVTSSFFGAVWRAVLRNSDFASFKLLPGANEISVFVNNTGATVTGYATWSITHWSADGAAA